MAFTNTPVETRMHELGPDFIVYSTLFDVFFFYANADLYVFLWKWWLCTDNIHVMLSLVFVNVGLFLCSCYVRWISVRKTN